MSATEVLNALLRALVVALLVRAFVQRRWIFTISFVSASIGALIAMAGI